MSRLGFVIHHDQDDHPVYTNDLSHNRCVRFWQGVKDWHTGANPSSPHRWSDIAYSFGVCRHGTRFEGRGWFKNQFAGGADQIPDDLKYQDSEWYSVLAFLGGGESPSIEMYAAIGDLISAGRMSNHCGIAVIPHNRFRIKTCPGPELTAYAASLNQNPHFQEQPVTPEEIKAIAAGVWDHPVPTVKDGPAPARSQLGWIKDEIDGGDKLAARVAAAVVVTVNAGQVSEAAIKAAVKAALSEVRFTSP